MFQVGDVVVCVDARVVGKPSADLLIQRAFYRIEAVMPDDYEGPGVSLAGMNSSPYEGYSARRFRKLPKASAKFTASIRACRDAHSPAPVA